MMFLTFLSSSTFFCTLCATTFEAMVTSTLPTPSTVLMRPASSARMPSTAPAAG